MSSEGASDVPAQAKSLDSAGLPSPTESLRPASSPSPGGEAAAVQPVIGINQRVHTAPKKKKDLGTIGTVSLTVSSSFHTVLTSNLSLWFLGYVLGILMMAIIIVLGAGITFGYFYKR